VSCGKLASVVSSIYVYTYNIRMQQYQLE